MNTWRAICKPIINSVLIENDGKTEQEIRKALRDAYPFGERKYHPYKIWNDEIKVQRKKRIFGKKKDKPDPNQSKLF